MEYAIKTLDLTKKFGDFTAVKSVNLAIKPGEICGFLGPNGAGKSTVMRMLCGILEPSSGSGEILGYDLVQESEAIKKRIGYMSQKFSLYDDLTVAENMEFYAGIYDIPYRQRRVRIQEMLELAQLSGQRRALTSDLSVGFKQRLALACAIISRPEILFLDEPTSGVSPTSRRAFFDIIHDLAQAGTTVIVSTHFMDEAERCHNIAFMLQGYLLAVDTPDRLKEKVIKGIMVRLQLPDPMYWLPRLSAQPWVLEASLHGLFIHVLLANEEAVERLYEITGHNPQRIVPNLEDVFISLAKQKN
ncbi:ABC transporter-like [Syntrophomonas zehnderi OL-4]|uniref:ABC transporter-like n=1 Tax=Syntrophomonas zehnderi OL-4 TaxID=690567 RepID=A0A0E3W2I1_9FIRM|nr:ABC transporter ATP-binding protein [Syntrophomonas zehnderi]CFX01768.1 ABC transporter-like [Syntrophomonas zehnderi OL-4]